MHYRRKIIDNDLLKNHVIDKRKYFDICFDVYEVVDGAEDNFTPDDFIKSLGFNPIGNSWLEVNKDEAYKISSFLLQYDMAYKVRIVDEASATKILNDFFDLFTMSCPRFFTNYGYSDNNIPRSYSGISKATFDAGVLIYDGKQVGIFWVMDED